MKELKIGNKIAKIPVIQGGMGVGVSLSGLAGAVAAEGGIGVISTAQIGYDEPDFETDPRHANLAAIAHHIKAAKAKAKGGLVGVNIMVALRDYAEHVKTAVAAGADVIISGAGLPVALPELVKDADTKIAPIVSTEKSARVILKMWDRKYHRTADFVVIEGPRAGGHLGFCREELALLEEKKYDDEVRRIISMVEEYAEKYKIHIPVILAGGIFDAADVMHALQLGADGVQVASRFVATEECDASAAYKQAYVNAKEEDVMILESPVGMPGRAVRNAFTEEIGSGKKSVKKCYSCLAKCDPANIPYCITDALIKAVRGDTEHGLIFCGANVGRIHEISTVHEVMQDLLSDIL